MSDSKPFYDYNIHHVAHLDEAQLEHLEKLNKAAFKDDPLLPIVLEYDTEYYGKFMNLYVIDGLIGGDVVVAKDEDGHIIGVMVYYAPGKSAFQTEEQREKSLNVLMAKLSETPKLHAWWLETFLPTYNTIITAALGEGVELNAMWNVQLLAVEPEFQRRGIARKFIGFVKSKAAVEGGLLELETPNALNVEIYERLGFSIRGSPATVKSMSTNDESRFWVMVQEVPKA